MREVQCRGTAPASLLIPLLPHPPPSAAPPPPPPLSAREFVLSSVNVAVLGSLFSIGATPRPSGLGVADYGGGVKTLGLCPPSPNCVSTAEEMNDPGHYVPAW